MINHARRFVARCLWGLGKAAAPPSGITIVSSGRLYVGAVAFDGYYDGEWHPTYRERKDE